jgi:amino acid transporter
MALGRWLLGRPLRSDEEQREQITPASGVAVLGLDALASAAYGPEAALTVLLAAGSRGSDAIVPIVVAILIVLGLVFGSYLQTLTAYPGGGGSYTVAKENLGPKWGVVAATALCTDYVLNVAVAIAAGVGALVSVIPPLLPHTVLLCLSILGVLTVVNLRGIRTAGALFTAPTYAFVAGLGITIVLGLSGRFTAPTAHASSVAAAQPLTLWLVLRAFASGCTALTGVEAVSNAVPVFRPDRVRHAKQTLTAIVAILGVLLVGVALFAHKLHLVIAPPGQPGYQSVLSRLTEAVFGRGGAYTTIMAAVLSVLCLSANTSFADFPRVCRLLAQDGYLPEAFASRGSRLVYTAGIAALASLAAILLVVFGGVTDALIPLFAVGAFSAFTLSQVGMVMHWRRRDPRRIPMALNAIGATATGATLAIIIVAKFVEGAWLTLIIIPAGYGFFVYTQRVHARTVAELAPIEPLDASHLERPIAVVPVDRLDRAAIKAVRFALSIADHVYGLSILTEHGGTTAEEWRRLVADPAQWAGHAAPHLHIIRSPYRRTVKPLLAVIRDVSRQHASRSIAVIIPERIQPRWYQMWVQGQRATWLKLRLLWGGIPGVAVVSTPWYIKDEPLPPTDTAIPVLSADGRPVSKTVGCNPETDRRD